MNKLLAHVLVGVIAILITILLWGSGDEQANLPPTRPAETVESAGGHVKLQVAASARATSSADPQIIVVDSSGASIPGAEVCVATAASRPVFFTNARGEVSLTGCTAGVHRLWVTRKGYVGVDLRTAIAAEEAVRVTLLRFAKVTGTATNARGEPVKGVTIQLKYDAASESHGRLMVVPDDNHLVHRGALSAADGRFELTRVIPNRGAVLHAVHPEWSRVTTSMQPLQPEEARIVDVALPDHTGIRGLLAFGTRRDKYVTLHVWRRDLERNSSETIRVVSVRDMEPFELRDLPVGEILIVASAADPGSCTVAAAQVTVEKGRIVDAGTLAPSTTVLRVKCEAESLANAREIMLGVGVMGMARPMTYLPFDIRISAEEASSFSVCGLPSGRAIVDARVLESASVMPDMLYCTASERVVLDGDTQVKLVLAKRRPPTNLVVDLAPPPGTPKGILAAFVWLEDERGVLSAFSRVAVGNSQFQFQNLSTGKMTLRAVAGGYTLTRSELDIPLEQLTTISAGDWTAAVPCTGMVVDDEGHPVAAASVAFTAPSAEANQKYFVPLIQDLSTDVEGRFSVDALPSCRGLQVAAWTSNTRSDPHPVAAGSASGIVLTLKKAQK